MAGGMITESHSQIRSDFLLAWVIANTIGLTIAGIVFAYVGSWPFLMIAFITGTSIGTAASGTLIGIIVGTAQWLALRRYLRTSIGRIGSSAAGWAFVGMLLWSMKITTITDAGFTGFTPGSSISQWAIIGAALGLATGVLQMLILPLHGNSIGLWLFFNTTGWAVALAFSWPIARSTSMLVLGPLGIVSGALGSTITGMALTWLLHDSIRPPSLAAKRNATKQTSHFASSDRIGGIGLFGIVLLLLALAVGAATVGVILLVGGVILLAYSLVAKR